MATQAENDAEAAAWRRRLRDEPGRWEHGVALRQALLAGYHYPDCDAAFRASTRHMPDDVWLAHYRGLALFHPADLGALRARAERMLAEGGEAAVLHGLLGHVATQQRDYAAAAAHLALSDAPDRAARGAVLAAYRDAAGRLGAAGGPGYAVAVINLDRNPERMVELRRAFAGSAPAVHRIAGVLGSALPDEEVRRLGGDSGMRGTLGCFLSHVAAWRWVLDEGVSHCLVVEDDVMPMLDLPAGLGGLGLPAAFDVCFVNDRMQPAPSGAGGFAAVPLAQALRDFAPDANAPGADGYLVTAAGARRLLAWVGADGCGGDVDWRLLAYGLSARDCAGLPGPSVLRERMDEMQPGVPRAERLDAWVLCPALIRTVGLTSDRCDENRVGE
ncbi:MAG: glycosyltransferase family 25 protein [Janthinobacterium lividum]